MRINTPSKPDFFSESQIFNILPVILLNFLGKKAFYLLNIHSVNRNENSNFQNTYNRTLWGNGINIMDCEQIHSGIDVAMLDKILV